MYAHCQPWWDFIDSYRGPCGLHICKSSFTISMQAFKNDYLHVRSFNILICHFFVTLKSITAWWVLHGVFLTSWDQICCFIYYKLHFVNCVTDLWDKCSELYLFAFFHRLPELLFLKFFANSYTMTIERILKYIFKPLQNTTINHFYVFGAI